MHARLRRRRQEAGISLLDVTAASFVVAISLVGLVSTVIYQRNLEEQTTRLWEATATATATLEDLRADSRDKWSSITSSWEGHSVATQSRHAVPSTRTLTASVNDLHSLDAVIAGMELTTEERAEYEEQLASAKAWAHSQNLSADTEIQLVTRMRSFLEGDRSANDGHLGVGDLASAKTQIKSEKSALVVSVSDDDNALDDAGEMWTSGASSPNFYHVNVAAASEDNEFANRLRFQTYVADRSQFGEEGAGAESEGGGSGGESGGSSGGQALDSFDDYADAITDEPTIQISGANNDVLTLSFENMSSESIGVESVEFYYWDNGRATAMSFAGTELYNGSEDRWVQTEPPESFAGVPPGAFDLTVTGTNGGDGTPFEGQWVWIQIKFDDNSKIEKDIEL